MRDGFLREVNLEEWILERMLILKDGFLREVNLEGWILERMLFVLERCWS